VAYFRRCEGFQWIKVWNGVEQIHLQNDGKHLGDLFLVVYNENAGLLLKWIFHAEKVRCGMLYLDVPAQYQFAVS
jgi:hypothetical protein